jgi:hypothetical protein
MHACFVVHLFHTVMIASGLALISFHFFSWMDREEEGKPTMLQKPLKGRVRRPRVAGSTCGANSRRRINKKSFTSPGALASTMTRVTMRPTSVNPASFAPTCKQQKKEKRNDGKTPTQKQKRKDKQMKAKAETKYTKSKNERKAKPKQAKVQPKCETRQDRRKKAKKD